MSWMSCLLLIFLALFTVVDPRLEGDTRALVSGVDGVLECLKNQQFSGCSGTLHFPFFQYLPALLLRVLNIPHGFVLRFLALMSFIGFLGVLYLTSTRLKKGSHTLPIFVQLILLTSPLPYYAHSSFGEMMACFLILAFAISCIENSKTWKIFTFGLLAGLTKETAWPFLLVLGVLCRILGRPFSKTLKQKQNINFFFVLGFTIFCTLIVTVGFNYFRFSSFYNTVLLNETFFVHSLPTRLSFFLGIWFSQYGGIFFFWTSFFMFWLWLIFIVFEKCSSTFHLPYVILSLILMLLSFGLSSWYAPMGWVAWGPRLMIPWIPVCLFIAIYFYSNEIEIKLIKITDLIRTKKIKFLYVFLWFILSLPQFLILIDQEILWKMFGPTPECPTPAVIQQGRDYYYHCMHFFLWPQGFAFLKLYESFFIHPWMLMPTLLYWGLLYATFTKLHFSEGGSRRYLLPWLNNLKIGQAQKDNH